jgi:hypothetical protein
MKLMEVNTFNVLHKPVYSSFHLQPSIANGGTAKPPPYPVEKAPMINEPPAPDPHTADLVSYVIKISQSQSNCIFLFN